MYAFHFTFEDQPAVCELAAAYQARLAGLAGLDPVPVRWLHLTVQDVGFTDEVADRDLSALAEAARGRLASSGPARVTVGPAYAVTESIVLRVEPVTGLSAIRAGLRMAISDVMPYNPLIGSAQWWPHISVAYSSAMLPAAPYEAALAGHTAAAEVLLDTVRLIVLGRDHHRYEWTTRDTIPLRGA
jgi:2'-5' RNA ligase superfamily